MKVLIFGVTGMLGHKVYQVLKNTPSLDVIGTMRGNYRSGGEYRMLNGRDIIPKVSISDTGRFGQIIYGQKPDVVINCIGLIKQKPLGQDRFQNILTNSLFPHQLYGMCHLLGAKFIHISTDCVFSGEKGNYTEDDISDAKDIYGRTKYLGEVINDDSLTIRTSIIGRELSTSNGLVEWLISNKGKTVNGYTKAIFTGFPTVSLANILGDIILDYPELTGLYQVSSDKIDKYTLLEMLNERMNLGIKINKDTEYQCDRSLNSSLFRGETGYKPPSWQTLIDELVDDAEQSYKWR